MALRGGASAHIAGRHSAVRDCRGPRLSHRNCAKLAPMRSPIEIPPYYIVLVACTLTLLGLIYAEGWTWPLKAAAVMIPVSLLVG